MKTQIRIPVAATMLALLGVVRLQAQPSAVVARIQVEPIETLRMADFDPIDPSSAPIVFRTFVTTGNSARLLRLEVDVESGQFGFLGTARLDLGTVRPNTTVTSTNQEFDTYDLDDASDRLIEIATERGLLPPDDYFFTLRVTDLESGEPVGIDTGTITTTNSGLQIDLVGPGAPLDQEPDVVSTPYPVFQWFSSASSFDFALYEVHPGQRAAEDIVAGLPVFQQSNVAPGTFLYPNAAEDLVEGKVYAWQINAISLTSGGPERYPSEMMWFTVEGLENTIQEDGLDPEQYVRIEIEPQEASVDPGGSVILHATVYDAEGIPAFDVTPSWSVVPSQSGIIDENGVFVAGDSPGVAAVVATLGELEEFASVEIGDTSPRQTPTEEDESKPSIQIIAPADGQIAMESAPTFAWLVTAMDSSITTFRVALRKAQGDNPDYESALLLWEEEVPAARRSLVYPKGRTLLESGASYFLRVTALDSTYQSVLRSPVTSFSASLVDKLSYELRKAWEEAQIDGTDSTAIKLLVHADGLVGTPMLDAVQGAGATIELVEGPWIQIRIPYTRLYELASQDRVAAVSLPAPHEYLAAPAVAWDEMPDFGPLRTLDLDPAAFSPVDVAVFEFGFDPVAIGEMLPNVDVRYHSFRADKRIEGSGGADTHHGLAVVRALAEYLPPNVTLHLVNFDTEPEFHHALDYMVHQQGVNVITCSVSWANAYDHYDGTSYFSRRVEQILSSETPLVVAAGNFAQSHWQADYGDTDGDETHNFDPSAELLELELNNSRYYNFLLSWNDWGGEPRVDLDMEIYNAAGELLLDRRGHPYASRSVQGPTEYAQPVERIRGFKPIYPGTRPYYVKVYRKHGTPDPAARNTNFELYVSPPPEKALPGPVVESSLAAGLATTDSRAVIPIGAVQLSHSSQGPTNDGRVRPDFSADGVVELDGMRIRGTSFATPRVAAALSLVFSRHPDWGINEAYDYLRRFAVQPDGTAGKNDHFGWGQLDLEAVVMALTS